MGKLNFVFSHTLPFLNTSECFTLLALNRGLNVLLTMRVYKNIKRSDNQGWLKAQ